MIVSAVIARSARARRATEDRSLVILVVPLSSRNVPEFTQPGFPLASWPPSIITPSELFVSFLSIRATRPSPLRRRVNRSAPKHAILWAIGAHMSETNLIFIGIAGTVVALDSAPDRKYGGRS